MHPKTVADRLGRIGPLTGSSLRGVDNRLEFQLAMTIRKQYPRRSRGGR